MHVIITGGTGLIGRALAHDLAGSDHYVTILSRDPARAPTMPAGVAVRNWDGRSCDGWLDVVESADALVNLAGAPLAAGRWSPQRKLAIRSSRIDAGRAIVDALRRSSPRRRVLIQSSAVGYYGPRGDEKLTEDSPPGGDFLAQLCVQWEACSAEVEDLGLRRAVVRTGVVLSRDGGALPRLLMPFRLGLGGRLGSGRQWMSWIHIDDEVAALRFLIARADLAGAFNLTAPEPVRNAEFSRALGRALGRPAVLAVPAPALRVALGEMATVLLDGQRADPARLLEAGFQFRFTSVDSALSDLVQPGTRLAADRAP